jgi:hypothetical protein
MLWWVLYNYKEVPCSIPGLPITKAADQGDGLVNYPVVFIVLPDRLKNIFFLSDKMLLLSCLTQCIIL